MPIKFRCSHCGQLLGIARSKAGEVFDCPNCGRSIRVPRRDGPAEPLPKPALNLQDAALVKALNELATIGQAGEPSSDDDVPVAVSESSASRSVRSPAPAPMPVAVEPPLAAEPIRPRPSSAGLSGLSASGSADRSAVLEQLAPWTPAAVQRDRGASRSRAALLIVVACGAAVPAFFLGMAVGRRTVPASASSERDAGTSVDAEDSKNGTASDERPGLTGRITWTTESGARQPDRGARVIVLPAARDGAVKLPVAGFRTGDSEADSRIAQAALQAAGGDLAVTDDDGEFEAMLPMAGGYHILALSRFQPGADEATDPAVLRILEAWFERPEQLLGRVAYHLGETRYDGDTASIWDYSFERAQ